MIHSNKDLGLLAILFLALTACAPTAGQLKTAMVSDPEILYAAMKKDPVRFVEVVNEVSEMAREQKETKALDEGFQNKKMPSISESRAFEGPKSAPITIVEYSDFQCGYCLQGNQTMREIKEQYGNRVRFLLKHLPLDRHPLARKMASLYEAVAQKDAKKALELKGFLFEKQTELMPNDSERSEKSQEVGFTKYNRRVDAVLAKKISALGLNNTEIQKLAKSPEVAKILAGDIAEAKGFGFTGTPAYMVNAVPIRGALSLASFKYVIDRQLQAKK